MLRRRWFARQVLCSTLAQRDITLTNTPVALRSIWRTLKVLGPKTVTSLLGREIVDEMSLSLVAGPVYGVRQEQEDGSVSYTLTLGQALGRRALMDLLYTLAPYKAHGPDRFARVLDNWGLHDRAASGGGSQALLQQHANSLKLSWQVFTEHRPLFFAILADQMENTCALPVLTWKTNADGKREWQFDTPDGALAQVFEAAGALPGSGPAPQMDALLGLVTLPYFQPELRKNWPAWKPLVKGGKSNYIGPASVPMMALLHCRALLNSPFVRSAEGWLDSVEHS
jgi:hypothetical protein